MEVTKMEKASNNGLDLFWKLGDAKKEKNRLDVVQKLLSKVNGEGNEKLDTNYVFTRLIRGMASPRSRHSFFLALTEMIRLCGPDIYSKIHKIKEEHLVVKGTKSEEGENAVGQLFVLGALLRSGVSLSHEDKTSIIKEVFQVSGKRSYLSSSAFAFLKDYVARSEDPNDEAIMLDAFKSKYKSAKSISSIDQAWISIILLTKWPSIFKNEDKNSKLTLSVFVDEFAQFLKEMSVPLASLKAHPGMHDIIRFLCEKELAQGFWTKHMDPYLTSDSTYRSSVAFIILSYIMVYLSSKDRNENITSFISRNFVGVSLSHLSRRNESSDEDRIILGIYENIIKVAEEVPESQESLIKVLLTGSGTVTFDKVTGGSLISRLSSLCSKTSVKAIGEIFKNAVLTGSTSAKPLSVQERLFALQQFSKLSCHSSLLGDVDWKIDSLKFLLSNAVFLQKKGPQWNSVTRIQAKNTFFKGLDIKEKSFENTCKILNETLLFASKEMKKSDIISDEHKAVWKKMMGVVKGIPYQSDKKLSVFLILFAHMGFQLFHQPEMAIEALNDLHICYEKARSADETKVSEDGEEEPKWTEVIVDILLSLLSQNRSILRQVVNTVFSLICPFITNKALRMIVDVINPSSTETEESDDEGEGEGDEDMESAGEEEEEEEGETSDKNEEDSSESEDEDMEEGDNVNDEIRKDVKSALGDFAVDSDADSIDVNDMDPESMKKIDEALAGVFRALCKKKSQSQKKREKKDAIAQIHFKIRALDMIDMYISRSSAPPPASHLIYLISPLLNALESTLKVRTSQGDTESLISCIKNLLKKISSTKKAKIDSELDQGSLISVLKMFVGLANRGSPLVQQLNHPTPVFSKLCCFLLRVIESTKNDALKSTALEVYEKSLHDYFCRSHCLLPCNFFSLPIMNNRNGMWTLSNKILFHTFDAKTRQFRRIQGFNLIMTYIKGTTSEEEDKRNELVKSCVDKIISFYQSESTSGALSKFICQSLNVLKDLHALKAIKDIVNWNEVKEALIILRGKIRSFKGFSDLRKAFNKIGSPLGIDALKPSEKISGRQKLEESDDAMEVDGGDDKPSKKKNKKRKSKAKKETLVSRKQKKSFELDGQFKGEGIPSFKGITSKQKSRFINHNNLAIS